MSHAYLPPYRRDYGGACYDPSGISEAVTIAGVASAVIGAGVSAYGMVQSSNAQSEAAQYNAEVAKNNQTMADAAAQTALQQGAVAQQQKAYQEDVLIGQEKAGLAANGVDVGSTTATELMSDTKAAGELDQLTIINNAQRTSTGFINQGLNYGQQAQQDQAASQATLQAGDIGATAAAFKGAGQVASTWYTYTQQTGSASARTTSNANAEYAYLNNGGQPFASTYGGSP